ncbi:MAG: hypothetical protein QOE75_1772 [Solirubrobacterales bacterium]|nr:hypothetical protein [Solirubrobacterales bacterium]
MTPGDFSQFAADQVLVVDLATNAPSRTVAAGGGAYVVLIDAGVPSSLATVQGDEFEVGRTANQSEGLVRIEMRLESGLRPVYYNRAAAIVLGFDLSYLVPAPTEFTGVVEVRDSVSSAMSRGVGVLPFERLPGKLETPTQVRERRNCPGGPRPHKVTVPLGAEFCPDDGSRLLD